MRLRSYGVVVSLVVLAMGVLPLVVAEAQSASAGAAATSAHAVTPAAKPLLTGVKLVVGDAYGTCALLLTGAIDCWGGNTAGQLGDGTFKTSAIPEPVTGITNAVALAGAQGDISLTVFCALLATGAVDCWGSNQNGALGNGSINTVSASDVPVRVTGINDATSLTNDDFGTFCVVHATGRVSCWGEGEYGELGNGTTDSNSGVPVAVTGITHVKSVAGLFASFCAVLTSGKVSCWGDNSDGRLGSGTTTQSDVPVTVKKITNAVSLMPDYSDTNFNVTYCALLATESVDCWGFGFYGEIGNGKYYTTGYDGTDVPAAVTGLSNATLLTSAGDSFCARLATGHVKCWGDNSEGELGNGGTGGSNVPVAVLKITNAVTFSSDFLSECATLATGKVDCWGYNFVGEIGDRSLANADTPVAVKRITDAVSVSSNMYYDNYALLTTGDLDSWGDGEYGQLGNGIVYNTTTSGSNVPVAVLAAP